MRILSAIHSPEATRLVSALLARTMGSDCGQWPSFQKIRHQTFRPRVLYSSTETRLYPTYAHWPASATKRSDSFSTRLICWGVPRRWPTSNCHWSTAAHRGPKGAVRPRRQSSVSASPIACGTVPTNCRGTASTCGGRAGAGQRSVVTSGRRTDRQSRFADVERDHGSVRRVERVR